MSLHVTTLPSPSHDVVVLALAGTPAPEILELLADGVAGIIESGQSVVLDVDELLITSGAAMGRFVTGLLARNPVDRVAFACGRLTGRRILRRWGGEALTVLSDRHQAIVGDRQPALAG